MRGSALRSGLVCAALGMSSACAKLVGDFDFVASGSASGATASGAGGATGASSSASGTGGVATSSGGGSTGGGGATTSSGSGGALTASASGPAVGSTGSGPTSVCGNGVVEAGEECDDGNTSNNDACLDTCKDAKCGDGFVLAGGEECDDGNGSNTDACTNACKLAQCGDGYVEAGVEECDDGNGDNTDACLTTCKKARCGDGFVEAGVEQCDDGNTVPYDRCGAMCQKEDPTTCPGTPIYLFAGQMVVINDNTTGASDKFVGSPAVGNCNSSSAWVGPDLVYAVTPATNGAVSATLTASYASSFLRVRSTCPGASMSDLDCHYSMVANAVDTIQFAVTAGKTYYVAADSYANTSGPFKLTLQLQ